MCEYIVLLYQIFSLNQLILFTKQSEQLIHKLDWFSSRINVDYCHNEIETDNLIFVWNLAVFIKTNWVHHSEMHYHNEEKTSAILVSDFQHNITTNIIMLVEDLKYSAWVVHLWCFCIFFLSLNPSVPIHYNCKQKTRKKSQHCFWINMRVSKWGQNFYFGMNCPFKWQYSLPSRYWKKLHYQFSTGIFSRISPWVLSDWQAAAVKHSCIFMCLQVAWLRMWTL